MEMRSDKGQAAAVVAADENRVVLHERNDVVVVWHVGHRIQRDP